MMGSGIRRAACAWAVFLTACRSGVAVEPTETVPRTPPAVTVVVPTPAATRTPAPTTTSAATAVGATDTPAAEAASTAAPSNSAERTPSLPSPTPTPVEPLVVPSGFRAFVFGKLPAGWAPTSIAFGPDGRLYVASIPSVFSTSVGRIWVFDAGEPREYARDLLLPAGIAFRPGTSELYVAHRASDNEGQISLLLPEAKEPIVFVAGLLCCYTPREHQPNGLAFGLDGWLYLAIGARSDHGEAPADPLEGGILRISPDGAEVQKFADGMRNPYDLAFDSKGQLWATDNGADFGPPEELNLVQAGGHYGWPFYANCEICPPLPDGLQTIPPFVEFPAHSTPVGLTAYTGAQFPTEYFDDLFVALWNPAPWSGIMRIHGRQAIPFATGLRSPIDVVMGPGGSLIIAEFWSGEIYRIDWIGG